VGARTGAAFARGAEVSRVRSRADHDGGAAVLVSRGCSPGASGITGLAAAAPPTRTSRANAGVRAGRRGGRGGAGASGAWRRHVHDVLAAPGAWRVQNPRTPTGVSHTARIEHASSPRWGASRSSRRSRGAFRLSAASRRVA